VRRLAWLALLPAAIVLGRAAAALPRMGDPDAPAAVYLSPHYIERGRVETGAPNMVTGILADYRSFDTLGETVVVLAAGLACLMLAARRTGQDDDAP
jgi:multicomponent Na+:H+ antiporter subunit B